MTGSYKVEQEEIDALINEENIPENLSQAQKEEFAHLRSELSEQFQEISGLKFELSRSQEEMN